MECVWGGMPSEKKRAYLIASIWIQEKGEIGRQGDDNICIVA